MSRDELIARLLALPGEMDEIRDGILAGENDRLQVANALKDCEMDLILAGRVVGKNEAERTAFLRDLTANERRAVENMDAGLARWKCRLFRLQDEFSALRAVARLISGSSDGNGP